MTFSFIKSFLEKEESNDLDKTVEINKSWRTTTIALTPENEMPIKKTKILWIKNASQKSKSKLKNKLEVRLFTGFVMTVI